MDDSDNDNFGDPGFLNDSDTGNFADLGFLDDSNRVTRIGYPKMTNSDPMYTEQIGEEGDSTKVDSFSHPYLSYRNLRLRVLLGNGRVPNYVKMVIEPLKETRTEVKELNKRNELLEEVKSLREENMLLKEKLMKVQLSDKSLRADVSVSDDVKSEDNEHKRSTVILLSRQRLVL